MCRALGQLLWLNFALGGNFLLPSLGSKFYGRRGMFLNFRDEETLIVYENAKIAMENIAFKQLVSRGI